MAVQLKQIQKYRNTIFIISGLAICVIILLASTISETNKKAGLSPLAPSPKPPTARLGSAYPSAALIDWQKVRIGKTYDDIQRVILPPVNQEQKGNILVAYYETSVPGMFHIVYYVDNIAVRIDRAVNERQEKITPEYFIELYGKSEILQAGYGEVYQLEAYKINENEYVITEYDTAYNNIYKIVNLNKEQYEAFKTNDIKPQEEESENDFEGR